LPSSNEGFIAITRRFDWKATDLFAIKGIDDALAHKLMAER
jgi:hypothetical protein